MASSVGFLAALAILASLMPGGDSEVISWRNCVRYDTFVHIFKDKHFLHPVIRKHLESLETAPDACNEAQYDATYALQKCFDLHFFMGKLEPHKQACLTREARERLFAGLADSSGAEEKKVVELLSHEFIANYRALAGSFTPTFTKRPEDLVSGDGKVFLENLVSVVKASGADAENLADNKQRVVSLIKEYVEAPCKAYVNKFAPVARMTLSAGLVGLKGTESAEDKEASLVGECSPEFQDCAFRFAFCNEIVERGIKNLVISTLYGAISV